MWLIIARLIISHSDILCIKIICLGNRHKANFKNNLIYFTNIWKRNTIIFMYMKSKFTCQTDSGFDVSNSKQFIMMLEREIVYLSREKEKENMLEKKERNKSLSSLCHRKSKIRYTDIFATWVSLPDQY